MYDELVKSLREDHGKQYFARDMEAADAIEELSKPKWIPVTEALPKNGWWCLVWGSDWNIPIMAFYDGKKWTDAQFEHPKVTHWMPLPQPPKEE